jgi:hypothetical protein
LTSGAHVSQDIDTSTVGPGGAALPTRADGSATPYTLELILEDGRGGEARAERNVTVTGTPTDRAIVDGCYVSTSNLGIVLAINCSAHDPLGRDLMGQWHLTTDVPGAIINLTGQIRTGRGMEASDVGLHTYVVSVLDSNDYSFTVPVDERESRLALNCSDGTNHDMLLPETSVDAVSEACFSGYNSSLKPTALGDPNYVGDVTPSCARTALQSVSTEERRAHENYNSGMTPEEVFTSCTVDFAQVSYEHD